MDEERRFNSHQYSRGPHHHNNNNNILTTTTNETIGSEFSNQNNNSINNNNNNGNLENNRPIKDVKYSSRKLSRYDSSDYIQGQNRDDRNWRSSRKERATVPPPIDPKNWFDIIVSCGFGARSYKLGSGFANPQFKVRFVTKMYLTLLVQLSSTLLWMILVLTSKPLTELYQSSYGIVICATIMYVLIYGGLRLTRCGGDSMCFMSYMVMFIFMCTCSSLASGGAAVAWICWPFIICAIWLNIATLALTNKCCSSLNILSNLVYGVALCSGFLFSSLLAALYIHLGLTVGALNSYCNLIYFALPLALLPSLAGLALVYETKKLIGGRRTDLENDQWIVAAIIL